MIPLPHLPYAYGALAPVISETALQVHHQGHHARYVEAVNDLAADETGPPPPLEAILRRAAFAGARRLFDNAAQAWNHAFFWRSMTPSGSSPAGRLAQAIDAQFGGMDVLGETFVAAGASHFGSGWVWLVSEGGRLAVATTHDADTFATRDGRPLLVCDLWEHAYYLDHRNDRAGYLRAWWDRLADWTFAQAQFEAADRDAWTYPPPLDDAVAPITGAAAYERALREATDLLDDPAAVSGARGRRLRRLLERIGEYRAAAAAESSPSIARLEARLRAADARVAERSRFGHPWRPMVGGDLRPPEASHG